MQLKRPIQRQIATPASLPAPVGGWNARDSLGDMAVTDAVTLENWFPGTTQVSLRYGYSRYATGISGQIETLMNYSGATSSKLFAIASGSIYNVTSGGAIGAADVTGLTNSRWQSINVTTAAGNYLQCVNGADKARYYTGAAWAKDGDGAPYDITGANSNTFSQINVHKGRTWFIQKGTLKAWYLATGSLGGAVTAFDLSSVAMLGGYLVEMATWTIDAGYGVDDLAAWITSKGEVIVYRGTDPSSASTWALVGIWQLGSPLGSRPMFKYAGDLLILTQDGLVPMSGALQSSRVNPRVALTDKIQSAVSQAADLYSGNFGWQIIYYARQNQLYLNIPVQENQNQNQYVMNSISKAWCKFTGWQANCWELFNDDLYFGGNGYVGKAWDTNADNGTNINGNALQAFTYLETPGIQKRATMMRPNLLTTGSPTILVGVNVDYDLSDNTSPLTFTPTSYGVWGTSLWGTAIWGGGLSPVREWQGASGVGYAFAVALKAASQGIQVQWVSTDLVVERGGIL